MSHFSSSTKCLFKGCGQEMHSNWWMFLRIKKPCDLEEAIPRINWTVTTATMCNFDDEFNLLSPQLGHCLYSSNLQLLCFKV
jgi:hypothetical protein